MVRVMKTTGCTAMKCVSIVAAALLATNALAQVIDEPASSNIAAATGEPEPLLPEKCELLEVVNGAKLWKGDCISPPTLRPVCYGKVAIGPQWITLIDDYDGTPDGCRFPTKSATARRVLKKCPPGSACVIQFSKPYLAAAPSITTVADPKIEWVDLQAVE